ncbi:hypothetical protein L2E82_13477 [Cichorium intybus]|uniref:Uncharacterized protein n=1 Tax=Cichorium intybus TaxID=13427 RepID=A0ACB9EXI4_CICIN|nr:hypothetical protein L2E82_13477 [Cichorium intybus]
MILQDVESIVYVGYTYWTVPQLLRHGGFLELCNSEPEAKDRSLIKIETRITSLIFSLSNSFGSFNLKSIECWTDSVLLITSLQSS